MDSVDGLSIGGHSSLAFDNVHFDALGRSRERCKQRSSSNWIEKNLVLAQSPSLLITDDDRDLRETLGCIFERRGFRTMLAGDGVEALEIVSKHPVDLLLLDLQMPNLCGLETLRIVKQQRSLLPCIVMSAALDEGLILDIKNAKAFSVLPKPLSCTEITSVVELAMWKTYRWRR